MITSVELVYRKKKKPKKTQQLLDVRKLLGKKQVNVHNTIAWTFYIIRTIPM